MKRHAFHRQAEEEYVEAAEYYARLDPELGGRFYDEIERLLREICQQPDRFRLLDAPIRRHFSDVFPYAVLYVDQPDRVLIVAVMHMKRRPTYWKDRLGSPGDAPSDGGNSWFHSVLRRPKVDGLSKVALVLRVCLVWTAAFALAVLARAFGKSAGLNPDLTFGLTFLITTIVGLLPLGRRKTHGQTRRRDETPR